MDIKENIIKHHLRNVYFISGNACAGKTTMSRLLAEKYGFTLYDMDERYADHRAIALPWLQPDTCYHMTDFHQQWTRPVEEQARWNMNSLKEQSEMVLVDLMELAQDRPVVADVLFSPLFTLDIIAPHRLVYLTVDPAMIRKTYFHRPEKQGFYDFVRRQPLAQLYFENIFQGLELTNRLEQEAMARSGFPTIRRREDMTQEELLAQIEGIFQLI